LCIGLVIWSISSASYSGMIDMEYRVIMISIRFGCQMVSLVLFWRVIGIMVKWGDDMVIGWWFVGIIEQLISGISNITLYSSLYLDYYQLLDLTTFLNTNSLV